MNIKKIITAICLTALTVVSPFAVLEASARRHIENHDFVRFEYDRNYARITNNSDETRLMELNINVYEESTGNFIASVRSSKVGSKGISLEIRNEKYRHFTYAQLPWYTIYNNSCYASGVANPITQSVIAK